MATPIKQVNVAQIIQASLDDIRTQYTKVLNAYSRLYTTEIDNEILALKNKIDEMYSSLSQLNQVKTGTEIQSLIEETIPKIAVIKTSLTAISVIDEAEYKATIKSTHISLNTFNAVLNKLIGREVATITPIEKPLEFLGPPSPAEVKQQVADVQARSVIQVTTSCGSPEILAVALRAVNSNVIISIDNLNRFESNFNKTSNFVYKPGKTLANINNNFNLAGVNIGSTLVTIDLAITALTNNDVVTAAIHLKEANELFALGQFHFTAVTLDILSDVQNSTANQKVYNEMVEVSTDLTEDIKEPFTKILTCLESSVTKAVENKPANEIDKTTVNIPVECGTPAEINAQLERVGLLIRNNNLVIGNITINYYNSPEFDQSTSDKLLQLQNILVTDSSFISDTITFINEKDFQSVFGQMDAVITSLAMATKLGYEVASEIGDEVESSAENIIVTDNLKKYLNEISLARQDIEKLKQCFKNSIDQQVISENNKQEDKQIAKEEAAKIKLKKEEWGVRFSYIEYVKRNRITASGREALSTKVVKDAQGNNVIATYQEREEVIEENPISWYMSLLPAMRSTIPLQGGSDTPGAMPGLNFKVMSNITKHKIIGFQPVYQHLGIDSVLCTMVGFFTGADGSDPRVDETPTFEQRRRNASGNSNIAVTNPFEGLMDLGNDGLTSANLGKLAGQLDSFRNFQSFVNFAVRSARELTVEINIGKNTHVDVSTAAGPNEFLRDSTNGNPKFKGLVKRMDVYHARQDRTWYIIDIEITDMGLRSNECINLTTDIDALIKATEGIAEATKPIVEDASYMKCLDSNDKVCFILEENVTKKTSFCYSKLTGEGYTKELTSNLSGNIDTGTVVYSNLLNPKETVLKLMTLEKAKPGDIGTRIEGAVNNGGFGGVITKESAANIARNYLLEPFIKLTPQANAPKDCNGNLLEFINDDNLIYRSPTGDLFQYLHPTGVGIQIEDGFFSDAKCSAIISTTAIVKNVEFFAIGVNVDQNIQRLNSIINVINITGNTTTVCKVTAPTPAETSATSTGTSQSQVGVKLTNDQIISLMTSYFQAFSTTTPNNLDALKAITTDSAFTKKSNLIKGGTYSMGTDPYKINSIKSVIYSSEKIEQGTTVTFTLNMKYNIEYVPKTAGVNPTKERSKENQDVGWSLTYEGNKWKVSA